MEVITKVIVICASRITFVMCILKEADWFHLSWPQVQIETNKLVLLKHSTMFLYICKHDINRPKLELSF